MGVLWSVQIKVVFEVHEHRNRLTALRTGKERTRTAVSISPPDRLNPDIMAPSLIENSGSDAVALFVFLTGTAGTWFVAANLGLIAHDGFGFTGFFAGGGGTLVWSRES